MLIANWHVLRWWWCRLTRWFISRFLRLLWFRQLTSIHVDDVLNKQITRQAMYTMTVDHDIKTTRWTLKLATRETDNATTTIVAFFGALATQIVLTWQNNHGFCEDLETWLNLINSQLIHTSKHTGHVSNRSTSSGTPLSAISSLYLTFLLLPDFCHLCWLYKYFVFV